MHSYEETAAISKGLRSLFVLTGSKSKVFIEEQIGIFTEAIAKFRFPGSIIVEALEQAAMDPPKEISIGYLYNRCRERSNQIRNVEVKAEKKCWWCNSCGVIHMICDGEYTKTLACICAKGNEFPDALRWNGKGEQVISNKIHTLEADDLFSMQISEREKEKYFNYPAPVQQEAVLVGE